MADEVMPVDETVVENENVVCDCNTVLDCGCEEHNVDACNCPAINARWGEVGHEIPGKFYQVYYGGKVLIDDEGIYDSFRANSEKVSTISVKSVVPASAEGEEAPAATEYPNYCWNKYGKAAYMESVEATITVNADLASENPLAHVIIDGKEFDLAVLDNPVVFVMNKNHKISIAWNENLIESFRIVKK